MPDEPRFIPLELDDAAIALGLPARAVEALSESGYLDGRPTADGRLVFSAPDIKAFVARNADNGSGAGLLDRVFASHDDRPLSHPAVMGAADRRSDDMRPEELLDLLDERADLMAQRVLKMVVTVYPEAGGWTDQQQGRFVRRTKSRFEAVLAVAALGSEIEDSVYEDLKSIGAAAANSASDLQRLLIILRMSRDLVVQNAVELSDNDARHGGYALSLLLTRILPAMDRLTDALSSGYWEALFAS